MQKFIIQILIPGWPAALANSIRVNGRAAPACQCADPCTLLAACYAADKCSGAGTGRGSQFVTMLLPEASAVLVIVTDTGIVRVPIVTMPVAYPAAGSG